VAPARYAGEAHRGGGSDEVGEPMDISRRSCSAQERRGWDGLGLNSNVTPLIPRA
jgi:hypothetical protein